MPRFLNPNYNRLLNYYKHIEENDEINYKKIFIRNRRQDITITFCLKSKINYWNKLLYNIIVKNENTFFYSF